MKTISTSELRSRTRVLVRTLERGDTVALTYRGQKLASILPVRQNGGISMDDPLYSFHRSAVRSAKPLTNQEIDGLVYG